MPPLPCDSPQAAPCSRGGAASAAALFALLFASVSTCPGRAETVSVGSLGFGDFGNTTVVGNDVDTGTIFSFENLIPTFQVSGYFVSMPVFPSVQFGPLTIDVEVPSTLAFGTPEFGSFQATSVEELSAPPGTRSFHYVGLYSQGSAGGPLQPNPAPAEFRVNFTESGSTELNTFSVSANATMSIPAVPEPPTIMLASAGLAGAAVVRMTRRKSARGGSRQPLVATSAPRGPGSHRAGIACRSS